MDEGQLTATISTWAREHRRLELVRAGMDAVLPFRAVLAASLDLVHPGVALLWPRAPTAALARLLRDEATWRALRKALQ